MLNIMIQSVSISYNFSLYSNRNWSCWVHGFTTLYHVMASRPRDNVLQELIRFHHRRHFATRSSPGSGVISHYKPTIESGNPLRPGVALAQSESAESSQSEPPPIKMFPKPHRSQTQVVYLWNSLIKTTICLVYSYIVRFVFFFCLWNSLTFTFIFILVLDTGN